MKNLWSIYGNSCKKTRPLQLYARGNHGTADIFCGIMVSLYVKGKENSYYVCNRKPGDGLIAPLRSIVFFALRNAMNLSATLREPSHPSMR